MKKIILGWAIITAITITTISCEKNGNESNTPENTSTPCVGGVNAFLLPDSLTSWYCAPNFSYFHITAINRTVKLNTANLAIDTIVNGGHFNIVYDSIAPLPCAGQIMNEISLRCFTRLP